MTLGTIIAIVLGIAVLVFLIFGFSTGWNNMWDKITNFGGGAANIDTIVQACSLACSSNSEYGFCEQKRELNDGDGGEANLPCRLLADGPYGIEKCSNIKCKAEKSDGLSGGF